MAFDFPANPEAGDIVLNTETGVRYEWDPVNKYWTVVSTTATDNYATNLALQAETTERQLADGALSASINANTQAIENIEEPRTYQIGTDKVMRAGEPAIELVDSEGYFSNVKFRATGGLSVTSDQQAIIFDGSSFDIDVQLGLLHDSENVGIKVNGS